MTKGEAAYLLGALDMWIDGYAEVAEDTETSMLLTVLEDREVASRIWHRLRRKVLRYGNSS